MHTYSPKALSLLQVQRLCTDIKRVLISLYGNRLDQVLLYGSYACGNFHAESDIDFLVILRDEVVKFGQEIRFMSDAIGNLSHQYDLFISVKPASLTKFISSESAFYQIVRAEGRLL